MAQELETIIKFAYPERDTTRPTRFFEALPDDAYEHAGEEILRQKREIEEKLKLAGRKRRKLVDEKVKDLEAVAQERLERLERLNALRQQFRRGVAGLLSMSGMSV